MAKRDYRKEYDEYQGTDQQKKRRAQRNRDRRRAEKAGKVTKGDERHVHHPNASRKGSLGSKTRVIENTKNLKDQPKRKKSK